MTPARVRRDASAAPDELRDYARLLVRAGYGDAAELQAEVAAAVRSDHVTADPETVAGDLLAGALDQLRTEQDGWPAITDYDRFAAALEELATRGVAVLSYVDDHWAAAAELERRDDRGERVTGIAWFTPPDVWHAVDHGMLELNLWHGDSANVAPGDDLLDAVLAVLARHGLPAHFDEGRIEVAMHWQRRR